MEFIPLDYMRFLASLGPIIWTLLNSILLKFIYLFIHGKNIYQVHKWLKNPKT